MKKTTGFSVEDQNTLRDAVATLESGDSEGTLPKAEELLLRHGDNPIALALAAESLMAQERFGIAYQLYKRLTALEPGEWALWNNLGRCYHEMARYQEAQGCFRKCLEIDPQQFSPACNMLQSCLYRGDMEGMEEWGLRAVKYATTAEQVDKIDKAMAFLHFGRRNWAEAWRCFDLDMGSKQRRDKPYVGEPRWDGTLGKKVVIYGEQGLGDEILFASMYPDALKDCDAILECDKRLKSLFERSFPSARAVYGTRHDKRLYWPARHEISARCAAGSLGRHYRNDGSFPRQPYLQADSIRRRALRGLLDDLPGRKIGVAWTGGEWKTRAKERSLTLSQLRPILGKENCTFISLEYKDRTAEIQRFKEETGIVIHDFPWATRSKDYDNCAALVSVLDAVVSVTTTVGLLAGALGIDTHILVNQHPTWHWGLDGPMPWLPVKLYRQTSSDWRPVINQVAEAL